MARPQRNNVDYFPFYCEDGNKMFYLEETYGNDGFAVFVKLLRELAKVDYHYLNLSKPASMMFLSAKCKVSKEVLESIIKDLVMLEKFDSELWNENKIIWCQDFVDSIQDAYAKRSNNCIDRNSLLLLLTSLGVRKPSKSNPKPSKQPLKGYVNPQRKEKERKEKEIKEEKKKEYNKFLMYEIEISNVEEKNKPYLEISKTFYDLIRNNIIELGANTNNIDKQKAKVWLDTFRLMDKEDNFTQEQLKSIYKVLKTDNFWKGNILSPQKLRKQANILITKNNSSNGKGFKQDTTSIREAYPNL